MARSAHPLTSGREAAILGAGFNAPRTGNLAREARGCALRPEAATGKHQGACGGRDKHEQGEHVVIADDQFQPTPGELDCPRCCPGSAREAATLAAAAGP